MHRGCGLLMNFDHSRCATNKRDLELRWEFNIMVDIAAIGHLQQQKINPEMTGLPTRSREWVRSRIW